MFAIVDGNNFYASCERVFQPALRNIPIVVLSNNDGCIVARSNEAKALGFTMGEAIFKLNELVEKNNVAVFSSNYALYGDMSRRVMSILHGFVQDMEVYSIDESFLSFHGFENYDLYDYGRKIVRTVTKGTGIPVSMGVAATKTLAKVASKYAKKYKGYEGVCIIDSEEKRIRALKQFEIGDVWGIGHRHQKKMEYYGIKTAYDFTLKSESWVRSLMTVTGVRTWKELQGIPVFGLENGIPDKKTIRTSRSFGEMIGDFDMLMEAVANFAASCARKLRAQHSGAGALQVFIYTNQFREDLPQTYQSQIVTLPTATNDVSELIHYARRVLRKIYKEGYLYKKAGVIVADLVAESNVQLSIFDERDRGRRQKLLSVMDEINLKYGPTLLKIATQGEGRKWRLKNEHMSKRYTTNMDDLIEIVI